ncbi:hypothetical protein ACJJTC_012810 [Scirpophaga incertulas]
MDLTPLFKAYIKTVKTRNKAFGIHSPASDDKQRILRTKPKTAFMTTARDITSQITRLRDFLLEHREKYLSFFNNITGDEMTDSERDQIDSGAQRIVNTCSHLLKEFRNDNRKISVSQQMREYMDAVIDLIDMYLKAVCKIHSELKALRIKRTLDISKLSRLHQLQNTSNILNPFIEKDKSSDSDEVLCESDNIKRNLDLSENEIAIVSDEAQLSSEELQMFEYENVQIMSDLHSMAEEVRQIESKVLHIAELQDVFTDKVLQQEQDIDRISTTVVGTTENVKDANEQIKQAIQRNAGLRVYILFFLIVMSFTLLFLDCRFIINLPPEDRGNLVRICFQIELAHWFYLDYYCTDETKLNPCGIREFAAHIFQHVPQLREHISSLDEVLDNWREYKQTVPTYGAILLDTDLSHVLLVQSYWTKASWGFPKGKVNEGEEPWKCAAREVLEETGFDISKLINKNDYIEAMIHDQIARLYIIGYIPRDTKFQPRTRNEIKACEWFPLADLPSNKKDMTPKVKMGVSPNSFFMVLPFVKRMRRWVSERTSKVFTNSTRRTRHKSMGEIESTSNKNKNKPISQGLQNEITEYQQQNPNQKPMATQSQQTIQGSNSKTGNHTNRRERKVSKRQLFTPQSTQSTNISIIPTALNASDKEDLLAYEKEELLAYEKEQLPVYDQDLLNFVAPSWTNFKFNRHAILDCFT